ncbi:MAG: DNA gyrase subunit A [Chloroflexota bacterium]|nr:MAG: DNA gyrase subunit A [Chloroflexota bacterium]
MEIGLVHKIDIDNEMQQAYLDYAMSVIVARALPDARDGLKPVHRRILYAMHDMNITPNSSHKKSARIVGEVLGKYHPHGDMAVYDAMARMAQDFSMRAMLVDGQGNFGSMDGDSPAAMRYTEARLSLLASHMLSDIEKDTVSFVENFDGTLTEPDVLPAAFPNMLVNGATGIAVGMATSIPPHNLGEVIDALNFLLNKWEKQDDISVEDLMSFIQGPDFPTGGMIIQDTDGDSLVSAYGTGRGKVTVQARAHLEEMSRGRNRIIITELPYMTNKSTLIERIATLVREEKLEGIADLRDESDRQGMRIVIELTKTVDPEEILKALYKSTQMRNTFSFIMLALVDGEPRMLTLKQALRVYLEHRLEIVRKRSEFDLEKARRRAHILEGLRVALQNLDEVIALIRRAADVETARKRLMRRFKLSEIQATAILDMPLRRLAALERKKIDQEYREVSKQIKQLEALLKSPPKMRQVVSEELNEIKETFGDQRRTQVVQLEQGKTKAAMLTARDLVPDESVWVMVSPRGLVSHTKEDKLPRLSGRDFAKILVKAQTRDTLYLVAGNGEAAAIPMHVLQGVDKPSEGVPFSKISPLTDKHELVAAFTLPPKDERQNDYFLLTATYQGMVKKSPLSEIPGPSAQTFTIVRVNDGDELGWYHLTTGKDELLMVTASGMAIRFSEDTVRGMGLVAAGVMGIKLQGDDYLVGTALIPARGEILLMATDGTAKRLNPKQFPKQGRYGQGVIAWKLPEDVQVAGVATGKGTQRITVDFAKMATKMIRLDEAPQQGRTARGRKIIDLKAGDRVTGLIAPRDFPRPVVKKSNSKPNAKKVTRKPTTRKSSTRSRSKKTSN